MEKDLNAMRKDYTTDAVIARGYAIYDEWKTKRLPSSEIVACAKRATASMVKNQAAASIEALSCLYALDMRIKERYPTFIHRLLSYFSFRREKNALRRLKCSFRFSGEVADVRTVIAIELKKLIEKLEYEQVENEDEESGGGKRNEKSDSDAKATAEKGQEQVTEENAEQIPQNEEEKESSEETKENLSEQGSEKEQKAERGSTEQEKETQSEEPSLTSPEEKEGARQEEAKDSQKEENNAIDEKSEAHTDKETEKKTYNDAIDISPIYRERIGDQLSEEKVSFLDEVIMDRMIRGKEDLFEHTAVEQSWKEKSSGGLSEVGMNVGEELSRTDKDAYLYDMMIKGVKDDTTVHTVKPSETGVKEKSTENTDKTGIEGKIEETASLEEIEMPEDDFEDLRIPLHVDITSGLESGIHGEIGDSELGKTDSEMSMTPSEETRKQLHLAGEEFGINAPSGISDLSNTLQDEQKNAVSNLT